MPKTDAERALAYYYRKARDPAFLAARAAKARADRRARGLQQPGPRRRPAIARFMAKIEREPSTCCWLWTGSRLDNGYATFGVGGKHGRRVLAHRFSYTEFVGAIPDDEELHHVCRIRHCVNPEHLLCLTHGDHMPLPKVPSHALHCC